MTTRYPVIDQELRDEIAAALIRRGPLATRWRVYAAAVLIAAGEWLIARGRLLSG